MGKIKVTLVKSTIGRGPKQIATAQTLGLTKLNKTVIKEDNDAIRGMVKTIGHLVKVEEV
jgi:large subunit ribosomal protein L30